MSALEPEDGPPHREAGLADFWAVFEAQYDEAIRGAVAGMPGQWAPVVGELYGPGGSPSPEVREAIRGAVRGDWSPYAAHLRTVTSSPAAREVPLGAWSDLVSAVESQLLGPTVEAYRSGGDRLPFALEAKRQFFSSTFRLIVELLLRNREGTIERELSRSEARKNFIVDAALDAIITIDHRSRILEFNPAAERMLGYSRAEVLGRDMAEFLMPRRYRGAHYSGITHMLATGHGRILDQRIEMPAVRADGSEILVELSVTRLPSTDPPAFTGFMRDVTEQRRAEEALRTSEARYRQLFEKSPLPTWVAGHASLRFLEVNDAAVAHYGYSREEFLSMTVADIGAREEIPALLKSPGSEGETSLTRFVHRKKSGERIAVEVIGYSIEHETGPARLVVVNDVTSRDRAEQAQRDAAALMEENRRILEASRLKSEFLANMSHELRTPLNAIVGFAELMHDEEVSPEETHEYLGDVLSSARHLLGLINDVLDLAKVEAGKLEFSPEQIACSALAEEVVNVLRPLAAGKQMNVEISIDPALDGDVFLDPVRLKQVLYNYLSNALKFTAQEGKVAVRMRAQGDDYFRLEVEDNGPGIDSGDLDRLFVEFQQLESGANRSHEGTGLGLALTRRLVEAQGGSVGVYSQHGRGSVFHAILPRKAVAPPATGGGG